MIKLQFNLTKKDILKNMLMQRNEAETVVPLEKDIEEHFQDVEKVDFLLTVQELFTNEEAITMESVHKVLRTHASVANQFLGSSEAYTNHHPGHPLHIFQQEITMFQSLLARMDHLLTAYENKKETEQENELKKVTFRLGELHKHFHRKEKLFFPMMERYGHYAPIRTTWRKDDVIRALYKGVKRQVNQLPAIEFSHVEITYRRFARELKEMLFEEEMIILPVLSDVLEEKDWVTIASESDAFGYVTTDTAEEWEIASHCGDFLAASEEEDNTDEADSSPTSSENIPFGGGYLTTEEANLILNHLPLEITFVDKNSVFKYFNKVAAYSDMMLVRTPISIGRNVANCHPPKSLSKVMRLVRDLKAKRKTTESMWFRMKGHYVHITYKGLFNEQDEFIGILEYVQDIQPFFELPTEVKRVLSEAKE